MMLASVGHQPVGPKSGMVLNQYGRVMFVMHTEVPNVRRSFTRRNVNGVLYGVRTRA